jgi:hypothetical protein
VETDVFCRDIEAHLCRRNAGHLVRIAGPAFEMVVGWAAQGIPLKVALRGIDACVERRTAKGPSRRPIRIEFCEADVLDAFDQWRRAVGVGTAGGGAAAPVAGPGGETGDDDSKPRPGHSLPAHLDRVVTRLTERVASGALGGIEPVAEAIIVELAEARAASRSLRGEARARFVERLQEIDRRLIDGARAATPADILAALSRDAEQELGSFRARMSPDDYARAISAATGKLVRDYWTLPDVSYE